MIRFYTRIIISHILIRRKPVLSNGGKKEGSGNLVAIGSEQIKKQSPPMCEGGDCGRTVTDRRRPYALFGQSDNQAAPQNEKANGQNNAGEQKVFLIPNFFGGVYGDARENCGG
jgi:hypothetical protein